MRRCRCDETNECIVCAISTLVRILETVLNLLSIIHLPIFFLKDNHIMSNVHTRSWCRRKRLNYTDHPQSFALEGKSIILIIDDHKKVVVEGMGILDLVNEGV